jgi:hypothetical protein
MRRRQTSFVASLSRLAAGLFLSASLAGPVTARRPGPSTNAPAHGTSSPKRESIERQGREAMLRGAELLARSNKDQRSVQAAAERAGPEMSGVKTTRSARRLAS